MSNNKKKPILILVVVCLFEMATPQKAYCYYERL